GKSTVLRCLNRLIMPTSGTIEHNGTDIVKMSQEELLKMRRSKMSMVFQHFGLFPHRTTVQNVEYGLEISGVDKNLRNEKALKAIEQVGLKGYENQRPNELSGGMQQRVGLARALANDSEILLMDEAFSALDPLIRSNLQDELLDLQSELKKTIVFITHDLDEALKLGDRIGILKDGEVVQIGTPEEILTHPADDYVRAFVQNVDRTKIITAGALMRKPPTIQLPKDGPKVANRKMEKIGVSTIYVLDQERKLVGIARIDDTVKLEEEKRKDLKSVIISDLETTTKDTPIKYLLGKALETRYPIAVLDDRERLVGIVDRASIMAELSSDLEEDKKEEEELGEKVETEETESR
ncbi:MAG TPA: betaine/proline/choline family ABC transporter ATP-binding protein, partial [Balneolales bacterium]|nr:betaine/proline/choline family ABC transporter ATP-binding protein [Balneolales bacterium]